jgi:hypothetical protein
MELNAKFYFKNIHPQAPKEASILRQFILRKDYHFHVVYVVSRLTI